MILVYVETQQDLHNLNRAALDGRFHITLNYTLQRQLYPIFELVVSKLHRSGLQI